ncbi:hypothetical protein PCASD_02622 [Puccinia coronata f. sp. avenae]|uniref:Uncharacterized protein n=1 Tax=Puccinia coronata f. sp. avenae TaxID=200324 RepID=A0A2N5T4Y2_9BASI|nr:hypothetical protein PCASD_16932 [Puccinia coronata f. sp. avenae]PLW47345.1 hypothetical protein PCASD_02622 [Puccinia coronata f. sp. avenae]
MANDAVNQLQSQLNNLQTVMRQQNDMIGNLQAAARAQALANSNTHHQNSNPLANEVMKQFVESTVKFYKDVNPQNPKLAFNGSNYTKWENAINRMLQHAFVRDRSFLNDKQDNFHLLDLLQNKAVAILMRSTLDEALLLIVESDEITSSKDLFELLQSKCKRSGRRHKIILTEKILKFATEKSPASEAWLACFCAIMSDVERAKITVNELGGLILQSLAKSPPGTDSKNFEYSISQPLDDMAMIPTFGQVTTVIQSALSKVTKGLILSPGTIPSDIEMSVNAIQSGQQSQRYEPPHKPQIPNAHPQTNGKFSVKKAAYFRGKGHTGSLNERYRYNCRYCGEVDHWYSDCDAYWEDVRFGRVDAPPPNHAEKGSRFVPPSRNAQHKPTATGSQPAPQSNGRIRKIDVPDASDGTVLLNSGSTIKSIHPRAGKSLAKQRAPRGSAATLQAGSPPRGSALAWFEGRGSYGTASKPS